MIEVRIRIGPDDLALIRITNVEMKPDGRADYVAEFVVERGDSIGIHTRVIYNFPRDEWNALALLKQVLETLTPEELVFSGDYAAKNLRRQLPHWFRSN